MAALLMVAASALGCNLPGGSPAVAATPSLIFVDPPTAGSTAPTPALVTPAAAGTLPAAVTFKVAVIVDTTSEPVTRAQAQSLVDEAHGMFQSLTGFGFEMVDFVEDGAGGTTTDMAERYIQSYASVFPNGVVIFSYGDNGDARLYGGYGYAIPGAAGFRNAFVSPAGGENQVYVAVAHFSHRYAACGYGGLETVQSALSVEGECPSGRPGVACVQHNGYSMCSDAVDNLYASTPAYFAAATIVHEILHSFSPGGVRDHYGAPECNARMGWPEGYFDLGESERYNGMCPFVYQNFIDSYRP
jgi:hypothetical protein